jgi:integrase/recombinase XerD
MAKRSGGALSGPLAQHAAGFHEELGRLGYSKQAVKKHLQLAAHLSRWLEAEGLDVSGLATGRVEAFFQSRREAGYANLLTARSAAPLVQYLRRVDALAEPEPPGAVGPVEMLLADFCHYLLRERGLVEGTVRFYVHVARLFLTERVGADGLDLAGLRAGDVTGFVARECERRSLSSARQVVSALRSLLRFLRLENLTAVAMDQAVLSVAGWTNGLPRAIGAAEVAALLASCDRAMPGGLRDYAILMLLSRLGLRAGEVAGLELADVDWRAGEVVIHSKGRRQDRLPLPVDVGDALAAYLRHARPPSASRRVFLRCYAPFVGLDASHTGVIRGVVARACERAGLPYASPHHLRHTAATQMLRAGASLSEIGAVLHHRSTATTAIYAKVDYEALRALARPWPVGVP